MLTQAHIEALEALLETYAQMTHEEGLADDADVKAIITKAKDAINAAKCYVEQ